MGKERDQEYPYDTTHPIWKMVLFALKLIKNKTQKKKWWNYEKINVHFYVENPN